MTSSGIEPDFPACSVVPQPTTLPGVPLSLQWDLEIPPQAMCMLMILKHRRSYN
jgi:hypothetical protein